MSSTHSATSPPIALVPVSFRSFFSSDQLAELRTELHKVGTGEGSESAGRLLQFLPEPQEEDVSVPLEKFAQTIADLEKVKDIVGRTETQDPTRLPPSAITAGLREHLKKQLADYEWRVAQSTRQSSSQLK